MAIWLILVLAAVVLAVLGAATAATWVLALGLLLLAVGVLWAIVGRRRTSTTSSVARSAERGVR